MYKTKIVRMGYKQKGAPVRLGKSQPEEMDKFTYLGSFIANDVDAYHDVPRCPHITWCDTQSSGLQVGRGFRCCRVTGGS